MLVKFISYTVYTRYFCVSHLYLLYYDRCSTSKFYEGEDEFGAILEKNSPKFATKSIDARYPMPVFSSITRIACRTTIRSLVGMDIMAVSICSCVKVLLLAGPSVLRILILRTYQAILLMLQFLQYSPVQNAVSAFGPILHSWHE